MASGWEKANTIATVIGTIAVPVVLFFATNSITKAQEAQKKAQEQIADTQRKAQEKIAQDQATVSRDLERQRQEAQYMVSLLPAFTSDRPEVRSAAVRVSSYLQGRQLLTPESYAVAVALTRNDPDASVQREREQALVTSMNSPDEAVKKTAKDELSKSRLYVQVCRENQRGAALALAERLRDAASSIAPMNVPGIERVEHCPKTIEIRYAHEEDKPTVDAMVAAAPADGIKAVRLSQALAAKTARGTLELWLPER